MKGACTKVMIFSCEELKCCFRRIFVHAGYEKNFVTSNEQDADQRTVHACLLFHQFLLNKVIQATAEELVMNRSFRNAVKGTGDGGKL